MFALLHFSSLLFKIHTKVKRGITCSAAAITYFLVVEVWTSRIPFMPTNPDSSNIKSCSKELNVHFSFPVEWLQPCIVIFSWELSEIKHQPGKAARKQHNAGLTCPPALIFSTGSNTESALNTEKKGRWCGTWTPPQKKSRCKAMCYSRCKTMCYSRCKASGTTGPAHSAPRQMTPDSPCLPLFPQVTCSYSWSILVTPKFCWSLNLFVLLNKHKNFSFSTLRSFFHGYASTDNSSKWPLLFLYYSAFLFLPFCFHSETVHACTKVFST